jgi:8-oxo-dGTP diphosphatase
MTAAAPAPPTPQPAVGVVCFRGDSVLLIRRARPPMQGHWSLPGGRIEWGERAEDAALRELHEETGVTARLSGLAAVVDGLFGERHYVLIDYAAEWLSGEPRPGDDATHAAFHPMADIDRLGLWDETVRVVRLARAMVR